MLLLLLFFAAGAVAGAVAVAAFVGAVAVFGAVAVVVSFDGCKTQLGLLLVAIASAVAACLWLVIGWCYLWLYAGCCCW